MIDIHCHILPGMDDGPGSIDETLEMCRAAAAEGVRTIVATPHFNPGLFEFTCAGITKKVGILHKALKKDGLDLRILPAAEIAFYPGMPADLEQWRHLTINNNGRYFIIEFPSQSVPPNWESFLIAVLCSGKVPIIAHPERNAWFAGHPEALFSAVNRGIIVQVTAMSITGGFGPEARDFSAYLLSNDLVHAIASDAHSADRRPALLAEAVGLASDLVGVARAKALVTSIPEAIIEGRGIPLPKLSVPRQKRRTWLKRLFR